MTDAFALAALIDIATTTALVDTLTAWAEQAIERRR
jgi:hypothetical protein